MSADEAARRLREFGPNALSPCHRISLGRKLLRQFTHFLALLLWIAACLAYLASAPQPGEGMETLAHAIVAVIVINALFSFCLTAVIVSQVANGFVCRRPRASFSLGLFSNRLLLVGMRVAVSLQLAIVYSPIGQMIFGTAALLLTAWLFAIPFALLLFAAHEGRKALARRLRAY